MQDASSSQGGPPRMKLPDEMRTGTQYGYDLRGHPNRNSEASSAACIHVHRFLLSLLTSVSCLLQEGDSVRFEAQVIEHGSGALQLTRL